MKDRARIWVLGDCPEAQTVTRILATTGVTLLKEHEFYAERDRAFALFFFDGHFLRPSRPGLRPAAGFVRIRETEEELAQVGVRSVPGGLAGARGFVACRLFIGKNDTPRDACHRFENAIREAERVCTRKHRAAHQNTQGRARRLPVLA